MTAFEASALTRSYKDKWLTGATRTLSQPVHVETPETRSGLNTKTLNGSVLTRDQKIIYGAIGANISLIIIFGADATISNWRKNVEIT